MSLNSMQNAAIESIYGAAAATLIDHLDFLVQRESSFAPAGWDLVERCEGEQAIQMVVPVPGTLEAKSAFEQLNHYLNFRKAIQRSTEAMSHQGCTGDDCPELWKAAKVCSGAASA
jgi:hypothetical protein